MAISDGMRTHDEGLQPRYRMPDLLTLEEMKLYFAGTYKVDIELKPLSDEMREKAEGVGTLPVPSVVSPRDADLALFRQKIGLTALEERTGSLPEGEAKELDSRTMTKEDFEKKYGETINVDPTPHSEEPSVETPILEEPPADPDNLNPDGTETVEEPKSTEQAELDRLLNDDK